MSERHLLTGDATPEDYAHDEELTGVAAGAGSRRRPPPKRVAQPLKAASKTEADGSGCSLTGPHDQSRWLLISASTDEHNSRSPNQVAVAPGWR